VLRALRAGELLDIAFARLAPQVSTRDRAWTQELVYGTERLRGRIDFLLARYLKSPIDALEPDVLDILRLGAYQLLEMHGVPAYAAVSQSVELTKSVSGRGATGLVNGVLQSLRRSSAELTPPVGRDAVQHLSTWGSHPRWLVERWLHYFGRTETERLTSANNQRPELFLRLIGIGREEAIGRLLADGMTVDTVASVPDAIRVIEGNVVRALELVPSVVQDPAAMLVVQFAEFSAQPLADLCAAPGGKSLAATISIKQMARFVVASDVSWARLQKVRDNAQRIGSTDIAFAVADARTPPLRVIPQLLIDAPCTGTGTLRRHPDGKWRIRPADLAALVKLQREILEGAAPCIAPGGLLVYATCSLEPEENEKQVEQFLDQHREFVLEPPSSEQDEWVRDGVLRVWPQRHGFDGAFAARLRRAA
jgi:16S rRNA (cytosine967-C5)-methyltransferase